MMTIATMLKKILKQIFVIVCRCWAYIYSPKLNRLLIIRYSQFYSIWISREFKSIGENPSIVPPFYLNGGRYITIGRNFGCDQRLRLDAFDGFLGERFTPQITIGDNVSIQKDCHIGAINRIVIGDNVLIASKVYISDHSHGEINTQALTLSPAMRPLFSKGEVIIEDNVWIGEGVAVMPNVIIGKNSIIGANSVVTKSIAPNSVVAGNPARLIRTL